jgi:hypothetical protein
VAKIMQDDRSGRFVLISSPLMRAAAKSLQIRWRACKHAVIHLRSIPIGEFFSPVIVDYPICPRPSLLYLPSCHLPEMSIPHVNPNPLFRIQTTNGMVDKSDLRL